MNIEELLKQVKSGALDIEEAERRLRDLPYEDLGYAKLDHHRKIRSGFPGTDTGDYLRPGSADSQG